jgi:hypothetical protein
MTGDGVSQCVDVSLVCERRLKRSLAPQMGIRSCEAKEAVERRSHAKEESGRRTRFPSLILKYPRSTQNRPGAEAHDSHIERAPN